MPELQKTEEQLEIIKAAKETKDNLIVIARAGAAKTTTLVMLAEELPDEDILCLAFNKKIAVEMGERLPENCESKTLHSIGMKAWWGLIRKKTKIDSRKVYQLTSEAIDRLPDHMQKEAYESMAETMEFISTGKNSGWVPSTLKGPWKPLLTDEEFFSSLPMEPSAAQTSVIMTVSHKSYEQALEGILDFDDMILCPAIHPSVSWPKPSLTLVDETQDLSRLNHHMLKKIVRGRRLIAVGDPCQAIYGFRGASEKSMDELHDTFDCTPYYLTISFRCSQSVTSNARWRAPDMKYPSWAKPGAIVRPSTWEPDAIQDGDAIICRNNAPLFSMAIKLLANDRLPTIAGRDIAKPLQKIMKKLSKKDIPSAEALILLQEWRDKNLQRAREGGKGRVHDQYECIRIMLSQTATLRDAEAYLSHLLEREGRIELMTGHKSKGLEFENVFFLDPHLCDLEKGQDKNIKYVIETRAMDKLYYVRSEDFIGEGHD